MDKMLVGVTAVLLGRQLCQDTIVFRSEVLTAADLLLDRVDVSPRHLH